MDRISECIPLVSVITPVYNSPDLWATLDSVLFQTYGAIEWILVDDGSETFCAEEIRQYVQERRGGNIKRFVLLQNETNLGTVRTMNRGLQMAQGRYFFQLAGDDAFADPRVLEDWVSAFQRTNALVMTAKRANYDEWMDKCAGTSPNDKQIQLLLKLSPKELFEQIAAVNFIFGCCTAYDGTFMRSMGFYDTRYRLIEDHPMCLRILRSGINIIFFDRVAVNYRGGGISSEKMYSAAYKRDADLVFQNEVIPYTQTPKKAAARYRSWKKRQLRMRKYQGRQLKAQGKPLRLSLLKAWFYAGHPIETLKTIFDDPGKLRKVFPWHHKEEL